MQGNFYINESENLDFPFLFLFGSLPLIFGLFVVWPQQKARNEQEALWAKGEILPGMRLCEYVVHSKLGSGGGGQV